MDGDVAKKNPHEMLLQFPDHPFVSPHNSSAVPPWFPLFPPKHVFVSTPVIPVCTTDPQAFRSTREKRQREAAAANEELTKRMSLLRSAPRSAFETSSTSSALADDLSLLSSLSSDHPSSLCADGQDPAIPVDNPFLPPDFPRTQLYQRLPQTVLLISSVVPYLKFAEDPSRLAHAADSQTYLRVQSKTYTTQERQKRLARVDQLLV